MLDLVDFFSDEENKHLNWIHIRMDQHVDHDKMDTLIDKFKSTKYAYCRETTTKDHTHLVVGSPNKIPTAPTMNNWIKKITGLTGGEKSTSQVRTTVIRMITYICKEQLITYKGFQTTFIDGCKLHATKKYEKEAFKNDMFVNEAEYYHDNISFYQFTERFGDIREMYGQTHTKSSVRNYIQKHYFKKHVNRRRQYYRNIAVDVLNDSNGQWETGGQYDDE